MKGKKSFLLLVLLILVAVLAWQLFFKKKSAKKKSGGVPVASQEGSPSPEEKILETSAPVAASAMPEPPQATVAPRTSTPEPDLEIPQAQEQGTEIQSAIRIQPPSVLNLPEGTSVVLADQLQVNYSGNRSLQYFWEWEGPPPSSFEIMGNNDASTMLVVGDIENPVEAILKGRISDGVTEVSVRLPLRVFPAQFKLIAQSPAPWLGLEHWGDRWVAARNRQLDFYDPQMQWKESIPLETDLRRFFSFTHRQNPALSGVFVQDTQGAWILVQGPGQVYKLPSLGRKIQSVTSFDLEGQPFVFALLEKSVELWNLNDPRRPVLKGATAVSLKDPQILSFYDRFVYVADEQNLQILDFSSGAPVAILPSGGSITGLVNYSVAGKNFLVASIGQDRSSQGRKDFGLRVFEVLANGRLGAEQRIKITDSGKSLPVQSLQIIPGVQQALMVVEGSRGFEIKIYDAATWREIPITFEQVPTFLTLPIVRTGKINGERVALTVEENQLRIWAFQAQGEPMVSYQAREMAVKPAIKSAAWVKSDSKGQQLWVGDEVSAVGGSVAWLQGNDLQVQAVKNSPGFFPLDGVFPQGATEGAVLYLLAGDPRTLPEGSVLGGLGMVPQSPGAWNQLQRTAPFLGKLEAQGAVVPLGIHGAMQGQDLTLGIALSRLGNSAGGAGLGILKKLGSEDSAAFVEKKLVELLELIPFQDVRDVAFSNDGKSAFLAAGVSGILTLDVPRKLPLSRMTLGSNDWLADRVLLSHGGNLVFVSFVHASSRQVIVKIFSVGRDLTLQEFGTFANLSAVETPTGWRAVPLALTEDDRFLFIPEPQGHLAVYNFSNSAQPLKVAEHTFPGEIRDITIANRYRDIFVALGHKGLWKLNFDFHLPKELLPSAPPQSPVLATPPPSAAVLSTPRPTPTPALPAQP